MKTSQQRSAALVGLVRLTMLLLWGLSTAMSALAAGASDRPMLVEHRAGPSELIFSGNQTFTTNQLVGALVAQLDIYVAGHPTAPLDDYLKLLERKFLNGYQRAGFAKARISALPFSERGIEIRINEGNRWRCGEVRLKGWTGTTNAEFREALLKFLAGDTLDAPSPATEPTKPLWRPGAALPADNLAASQFENVVGQYLVSLGAFDSKVQASLVPRPEGLIADLVVTIVRGENDTIIETIRIEGLKNQKRDDLLEYLKLKEGQKLQGNIVETLSAALQDSGRFLQQEVKLLPGRSNGKLLLELNLTENISAPPLNEPFSKETEVLFKFRDWLKRRETREDIVATVNLTNGWYRGQADVVLGSSGATMNFRWLPDLGRSVEYAIVAMDDFKGFYSIWNARKFVVANDTVSALVKVLVVPETQPGALTDFAIQVAGGFRNDEAKGFELIVDLHPGSFILEPAGRGSRYSLQNGELRLTTTNGPIPGRWDIRIDANDGRPRLCHFDFDRGSIDFRAEVGALAQSLRRIAEKTSSHTNLNSRGEVAPFVTFFIQDLLHSPLVEAAVQAFDADPPDNAAVATDAHPLRIKPVLITLRTLLDEPRLAALMAPLTTRLGKIEEDELPDTFVIPEKGTYGELLNNPLQKAIPATLSLCDSLLPQDTWPATLARDALLAFGGHAQFLQSTFHRCQKSGTLGPVGSLMAAKILEWIGARAADQFVSYGTNQLNLGALYEDYTTLTQKNSVLSQIFAYCLSLVRSLTPAQVETLTSTLKGPPAAFLRDLAGNLARAREPALENAAWSVIERHWESLIQPQLKEAFGVKVEATARLTEAEKLFREGMALLRAGDTDQNRARLVELFRTAAEQKHPGAQLKMGEFYRDGFGVRVGQQEAIRWFMEAAAQEEPHAACALGNLYADDLAKAEEWYRKDALRGCANARFNLGQIHDRRNEMEAALKWYRLAATDGHTKAQATLGALLSNGIFVTPDLVEAGKWLSLAAKSNDPISVRQFQRLKARLTPEQRMEAKRAVDAVVQSQNSNTKNLTFDTQTKVDR